MVVLEVTTPSGDQVDGLGVWWTAVLRRHRPSCLSLQQCHTVGALMPARVATQRFLKCLVQHLLAELISQGQATPDNTLAPRTS